MSEIVSVLPFAAIYLHDKYDDYV